MSTETDRLILYISTKGDDGNSGRTHSEAFATLEGAREGIRRLRDEGGFPSAGILVLIGPGTYTRDGVFELTGEDSGVESAPIVYRGEGDVVLSGGKRIEGFEAVSDPAILERLDPAARDRVLQADLGAAGMSDFGDVGSGELEVYFDGDPMTLARWPNEGFVKISGLLGGDPVDVRGTKGDHIGSFTYDEDRPSRWIDEKDPWVHGYWFWDWADQRHPVDSIDPAKKMIHVKPPYHRYGYRVGQWFYALNLLSELDAPGEWYVDRETGILYLYAPASIDDAEVVVSDAACAMRLAGVSNVSIEGIVFEAFRQTAIEVIDGEGCVIKGCTLRNCGSGVSIEGGRDDGVVDSELHGISNYGISLRGGDRPTLARCDHYAVNNDISDYGRWNRMYQPGVSVHGVGVRVANNRIHNAPHMGVQFSGNDHLIEYNEIFNVCYESNDAGAIYSGRDWTMRGTVIRFNYLHDITGFEERGCVGIYLDDMFCGTVMHGNLFYRVTRATFVGGGRDCAITNNVYVDCSPAIHIDDRAMNWASYHVDTTMTDRLEEMPYRSDLWAKRYPELVSILDDEPAAPRGNVVARNICVGGQWDEVKRGGRRFIRMDDNYLGDDPHFRRPRSETFDAGTIEPDAFEFADDSPAFALGFEHIPIREIGLRR